MFHPRHRDEPYWTRARKGRVGVGDIEVFTIGMSHLKISVLAFVLVACGPEEIDHLDCCENTNWDGSPNHNSILFQVESGNTPALADSMELARFLSAEEMGSAFDSVYHVDASSGDTIRYRHWRYTPIGHPFGSQDMTTVLLLIEDKTCHDRDYRIQLRTYTTEHRWIDSLTYALWSKCPQQHVSGVLYSDRTVKRHWEGGKEEIFRMTEEGHFVNALQ